ncbi:MAG: YihY/virulence factor BrkB family protein [Oscillospiraceae bacterium]|nr:YihY/virulence factor BrkB family protein [Oscillospiraceae bacterium]
MKRLIEVIRSFTDTLRKDNISSYAASSAYFFMLSFIPLIMLFVSFINYTDITREQILRFTSDFFPEIIHLIISAVISEVYDRSTASISFSALFTLWSAGKAIMAFKNGMHSIAQIMSKKNYFFLRLSGAFDTIVFVLIIIVSLILVVSGEKIESSEYVKKFFSSGLAGSVMHFRKVIIFFVSMFIFLISYKIIPDWEKSELIKSGKIKFSELLPGALFSAFGWYGYSFVFSLYMKYSRGFANMYGSMSILTGVMLWLYGSMYLVLLGLEVNVFLKKIRNT